MSSEESDVDEDIPPADECQKRCLGFAEITGTDTACAQFYLQDRKWDLEKSVNAFFEDRANKGAVRVNENNESEVVIVLDGSSRGLAAAATAVVAETALSRKSKDGSAPKASRADQSSDVEPYKELKFISWNVDGLNEKNLKLRTKSVYKRIINEQADIVFLQELVPESAEYFLKHLQSYECLFGGETFYFTGTFLKKTTVKVESHTIIDFPDSTMKRNILKVNAQLGHVPLCLMNVHLESTVDHSHERKNQLQQSFSEIMSVPDNRSVIFAGDMNLRDAELAAIGGLPTGVEDVWISLGSRKTCSYTWDMVRNDNLMYNDKFKPRCRFDRVYFRGSSPAKLLPKFFGLIGLERLLPHRCFPSDHWGILCHFGVEWLSSSSEKVVELLEVTCNKTDCPVQKYAEEVNLTINYWPYSVPEGKYDVGIVASFGHLIPTKSILACKYGMINAHPSLLPRWRGAAPIIYSILSGDKTTGVSIVEVSPKKFDVGKILTQQTYDIPPNYTSQELTRDLAKLAAKMVLETLRDFPHALEKAYPQPKTGVTYALKLKPEMGNVEWTNDSADDINRKLRAFHGFVKIYTFWKNIKVLLLNFVNQDEVAEAKLETLAAKNVDPGFCFFHKKRKILFIKCQDGWVGVTDVSVPVRGLITAADFYNGFMTKIKACNCYFKIHPCD